ncbi:thioredoxin [Chryseobacterium sp. MFBS3-17]|uniref:thioredoxin n=1 Tax=Chryseobacterium sp. MFBS3-17 TaxID=2886689 RepID=UPI001D0EB1DC|nr:thioredoxin [Chryseobacterium sp. MFBS3-17]MCC2590998.1 thioredoxin [Chryseobacterium sp. MFBS3-17]
MTFQEVIQQNKPVLVDFFAEWCGPCKMMAPILEEVKATLPDSASIIKIDVDKNPQAALVFQVRSVPTLILFRNGKAIWRHGGVVSASELIQLIRENL